MRPPCFVVIALAGLAACATPSWRGALDDAGSAPAHERAELTLIAGDDPARAAQLAEEALEHGAPGSPAAARAFLTLVVASDALGDFERPLPWLARALDGASDPALAARIAAEAGRAWGRLDGQDAASPEVRAALERLAQKRGDAWEAARSAARRELITAERLRAGPEAGMAAAEAAGFILAWRLSAPWGDAPALDFVRPLGPETRALASHERTGAGWDLIATATVDQVFSDGEVTFFDLPASGAIGFAEAELPERGARHLMMRLESNRLARVLIDGVEVLARTDRAAPWLGVTRLALPAGAHRLTVKLASHDGRGFFRVQLSDLAPPAGPTPSTVTVLATPVVTAPPVPRPGDARTAVRALLDLEDRLSRPRWDPDGARADAFRLEASFGPHRSLDLLMARLALGDGAAPVAERRQRARARFEAVLSRDPDHPVARRGLARIERDDERPDRALALLRADEQRFDPRTRLDLLDLYRERGWEAEALASAESLMPQAPASPRVMQELIDLYKEFGRLPQAAELAAELERRFPGAGIERLAQLANDAGLGDPELQLRQFLWEPQRHATLRAALLGMRRLGDVTLAERVLNLFLHDRPQDGWALAERVRIALQAGDALKARERIRDALRAHPDFAPLEALGHFLAGEPEPLDTLEEGRLVVQRWLAFKATPAGRPWASHPIVNVLERTRILVRPDGSTLELSHRVRAVETKQGADQLGDVRPPDGARLLVARTLKGDGRVLVPERTAGKAELSFPELQPGDAVETAWVTRSRVAPNEGGYLTGVSFGAWGAPIFELDVAVQAAPGLALALTRFGDAPEPTLATRDGGPVMAWRLTGLPAIAREPLSVSPRSFFPFADVRISKADVPPAERDRQAWARIARSYAARALELGLPGPRIGALAKRFLAGPAPAEAAFEWVKTELNDTEQLNAFETPAEVAVANKKGNRALVLWALLSAMRLDSDLYLCAPERDGPPEDGQAPTPNPNRFFYPVVVGPAALWLDPARPYTPPGDLPAELGGATCLQPLVFADPEARAARFVTLPAQAGPPTFEAELTLTLDAAGHARGTLSGLARGAGASPLRQAFLAQDDERQRMLFEQWLSSLAVGARLLAYDVADAASSDRPMRWTLEVELRDYATRDGERLVVQRPLKPLMHGDFAGVADLAQLVSAPGRVTPLRLLPFSEKVTLKLTAPPGMLPVAPAPALALRGFTQESALDGATLTLTRTALMLPGRVNPSEYEIFRRDLGTVIRTWESALRFQPSR